MLFRSSSGGHCLYACQETDEFKCDMSLRIYEYGIQDAEIRHVDQVMNSSIVRVLEFPS